MYGDVTLIYAIGMPGMGELVVILLIVLLLFGAKRIPEMARGIGSGIREFKKSLNGEPSGEPSQDTPKENDKK